MYVLFAVPEDMTHLLSIMPGKRINTPSPVPKAQVVE